MTEQECLSLMTSPGTHRPGKYGSSRGFGGVIQILVTRACNEACFNCTQGSNHSGPPRFMTPDNFRLACLSLKGYPGICGMFGGNPALHPQFDVLCEIMREEVPANQRGLWCNNPMNLHNARAMRQTFDPSVSNLNVHLDRAAYDLFKTGWPECSPVGLTTDSRHSPVWVAMKDVVKERCRYCEEAGWTWNSCSWCHGTGEETDESRIWELVSSCDINRHWSAMIGEFRGQLRAWFCEIAGAQAVKHQDEPDYPDTGIVLPELSKEELGPWWSWPMSAFANQVRKHCFDCGVPLRGYGELAMAEHFDGPVDLSPKEQVSATHAAACKPKRPGRVVETVTSLEQLGIGRLTQTTKYLQNANV